MMTSPPDINRSDAGAALSTLLPVIVVLPAYNEERDLPRLLERLHAALGAMDRAYEVIVVDDGSRDRTAGIVETMAEVMPVRLVRHVRNLGLGRAIQTGLAAAAETGGIVVTMDADNSHDPRYITDLVAVLESQPVGVAIASRFRPGSRVQGVPWYRRLLSWGCFAMMKIVLPYPGVRDYSTGFRAYRPEVVRALSAKYGEKLVEVSGFACMLEILAKLRTMGAGAKEIPYILRYDEKLGASKLRIFRTLKQYAFVVRKFRLQAPAGPSGRSHVICS